jgi:hypothetical protein
MFQGIDSTIAREWDRPSFQWGLGMRFIFAAVALFLSGQSDASPLFCDENVDFCPTIALSITDAATGKPLPTTQFDFFPLAYTFELLNLEFVTTFKIPPQLFIPVPTGIAGIQYSFGTYSFGTGSPVFIETGVFSSKQTSMGEDFFFSGYFTTPGLARIHATVFDNAGNFFPLGGLENNGEIISVLPSAPECSTWAMLLIGFAAIGFAGHRRSRSRQIPVVAVGAVHVGKEIGEIACRCGRSDNHRLGYRAIHLVDAASASKQPYGLCREAARSAICASSV